MPPVSETAATDSSGRAGPRWVVAVRPTSAAVARPPAAITVAAIHSRAPPIVMPAAVRGTPAITHSGTRGPRPQRRAVRPATSGSANPA